MKKLISSSIFAITLAIGALTFATTASAEEFKMVGTIKKMEMAADGKSATVILNDNKTEADVSIIVNDDLTLDKFKDKRIVVDDEIRCKYDNESGKNVSKMFKKTAGC